MSTSLLVKSIIENTYADASALNTALSDNSVKWDFINAINEPYYSRILFEDSTQAAKIYGSTIAKNLILKSEVALSAIGSSYQACKNFFNVPSIAKEVLTNRGLFLLFRLNFKAYSNMKACVNETKLKRQIFTSSGSFSLPATECLTMFGIGGGGNGDGSGSSTYSGGGGEVRVDKYSSAGAAKTLTITIGIENASKLNDGTSDIFSAATESGHTGGGSNTSGGLSTIDDRDFLNAPFLFNVFSAKGEDGVIYDSANSATFPTIASKSGGINGFTEWGKGAIPSSAANAGIIVIYYLET